MTHDYAHDRAAADQRREKATELARQLYSELTPAKRRQLERDAQQRRASDETWALAALLLSRRLRWDADHPPAVVVEDESTSVAAQAELFANPAQHHARQVHP